MKNKIPEKKGKEVFVENKKTEIELLANMFLIIIPIVIGVGLLGFVVWWLLKHPRKKEVVQNASGVKSQSFDDDWVDDLSNSQFNSFPQQIPFSSSRGASSSFFPQSMDLVPDNVFDSNRSRRFGGMNSPTAQSISFEVDRTPSPIDQQSWASAYESQQYFDRNDESCPEVRVTGVLSPNMNGAIFNPPGCDRNSKTNYLMPDGRIYKWNGTVYYRDLYQEGLLRASQPSASTPVSNNFASQSVNDDYPTTSSTSAANYQIRDGKLWVWNGREYEMTTDVPSLDPSVCSSAPVRILDESDPNNWNAYFDPAHCKMIVSPDVTYVNSSGQTFKYDGVRYV